VPEITGEFTARIENFGAEDDGGPNHHRLRRLTTLFEENRWRRGTKRLVDLRAWNGDASSKTFL